MNSINSKVIIKKFDRLNNVNKHVKKIVFNICKGSVQVRPVYKIEGKKTIIDTFEELTEILNKLNINFVVTNTAIRGGRIGLLITIKTHVINGNNTTKTQ